MMLCWYATYCYLLYLNIFTFFTLLLLDILLIEISNCLSTGYPFTWPCLQSSNIGVPHFFSCKRWPILSIILLALTIGWIGFWQITIAQSVINSSCMIPGCGPGCGVDESQCSAGSLSRHWAGAGAGAGEQEEKLGWVTPAALTTFHSIQGT